MLGAEMAAAQLADHGQDRPSKQTLCLSTRRFSPVPVCRFHWLVNLLKEPPHKHSFERLRWALVQLGHDVVQRDPSPPLVHLVGPTQLDPFLWSAWRGIKSPVPDAAFRLG